MNGAAEREILNVVYSYCRAIDRCDWDLMRTVYHPGAVDIRAGFEGTVEHLIPWLSDRVSPFDGSMHMVLNHQSTVRGDRAVAESYGVSVLWGTPADDPAKNLSAGMRYVDRLERREGRWAIAERTVLREWTSALSALTPGTGPLVGQRDSADESYRALAWLDSAQQTN
jgi:hypothetical protein